MRIVIAGGTGSLGRRLTDDLAARGHEIVVLTRRPRPGGDHRQVEWDARGQGAWAAELDADEPVAVVNLAGRLVDCRPTPANVAALRRSRVDATRALVVASRAARRPVARWLQASTTAIWSDAGERRLDERSPVPSVPPGLPQMTGVAAPWEAAVVGAAAEHLTVLRSSIVLDAHTPALDRLLLLSRLGLGGSVGPGDQWFSWVHVDDWLTIARGCLGLEPGLDVPPGVVVAAAPHPVRNATLMATLRRVVGRPFGLPTPSPLLRLGALALRTDPALALTGRHATSTALAEAGMTWAHPELHGALREIVERERAERR